MRSLGLLLAFAVAIVSFGADQKPASTSQAKEPTFEGKTLSQWMAQARDPKEENRESAFHALGNMGPAAIPALTELLKDKDSKVCSAAADAVGHLGLGASLGRAGLRTKEANFEQIGPELNTTVPLLVELLKDNDAGVRQSAAWALGQVGCEAKTTVPLLTGLLKDRHVRLAAAHVLGSMGPEARTAIPALTELLNEKNEAVQEVAARTLGYIGPEARTAVPALCEVLKGKSESARRAAAKTLGEIGQRADLVVPALSNVLQDKQVRDAALDALGGFGPEAKTAVPALIELLKENDNDRWKAEKVLGRIGPEAKAAVPALANLLRLKSEPELYDVLRTLGKIGPDARTAVPAIVQLLKSKDDYGRELAVTTLREIGPDSRDAVPALIELVAKELSWNTFLTLERIGPEAKAAIPAMAKILKQDNQFRPAAALVLGSIGSASIPSLVTLLKDKDEGVQRWAIWALGEMGQEAKTAVPTITELAKSNNLSVRRAVARTLGRIGREARPAIPALSVLLKDKEVLVQWAAVNALGEIGPEGTSIPTFKEMLNSTNSEVRDAAASVLQADRPATQAPEAEVKSIKRLIADLAKIDDPDFGFSSTLSGEAFVAVPGTEQLRSGLLTYHGLKRNNAFTSLVKLGPKALPFLLESLDDRTPTKLTMRHHGMMGGMWFGHEIPQNALNKHERKVLAGVQTDDTVSWYERHVTDYTLKVGDICFVVIGQITNRSYQAVRYQPTACVVINSPVEDHKLAAEVRGIWGKSDHRRKLLDSLLLDFEAEDVHHGASMRLAYYYPEASEELILAELKELERATRVKSNLGRYAEADQLVKVATHSPCPRIRAGLLEILRTTMMPELLLAALPAIGKEHDELVFRRLTEQLDDLLMSEPKWYGDACSLLIALGNRFPNRAEKMFRDFSKPLALGCRRAAIHALQETCGHLAANLLAPLLEDKRVTRESYPVTPGQDEPRLPIRICDEAAATIAMHSRELKFVLAGSHEDLDRQIEVVRRKLAEMNKPK